MTEQWEKGGGVKIVKAMMLLNNSKHTRMHLVNWKVIILLACLLSNQLFLRILSKSVGGGKDIVPPSCPFIPRPVSTPLISTLSLYLLYIYSMYDNL